MEHSTEVWKPVVGYEDLYEVSSLGRVRGLDRWTNHINGAKQQVRGRVLRPKTCRGGYREVSLRKNESYKTLLVHGVVAEAFLGSRPLGMQVNHRDGDKPNNHVKNLEYCTPSENGLHAYAMGLRKVPQGEASGAAKLTEADVREIWALKGVCHYGEVAKRFSVGGTTIHAIWSRRTWRHLELICLEPKADRQ